MSSLGSSAWRTFHWVAVPVTVTVPMFAQPSISTSGSRSGVAGVVPTTVLDASSRSATHCSAGCAWYVAEFTWLGSADTALTTYVPAAIGAVSWTGPRSVGPVR